MSVQVGQRRHAAPASAAAGACGLAFVGLVVVQNVLRAGAPKNDAPTDDVVRYFADHRPLEWLLVVTFVLGGFALAYYAGGLAKAVADRTPEARDWLVTGLLGVAGIVAIFTAMVACEVGLVVGARDGAIASTVVPTLWTLHNALFALLNLVIAVALLGLSRAAVAARLAGPSFHLIGAAGAVLLAFAAALAPVLAETTSPALVLALVGFIAWLGLLVVTGRRLIAEDHTS
jgi:hypothetical protein